MSKHTSKQEAEQAVLVLRDLINNTLNYTEWFKKINVDSDDHGYYLELIISKKPVDFTIPGTVKIGNTSVKVLVLIK